MRKLASCSVVVALVLGASLARADELTLRDRTRIVGKITAETDSEFVVSGDGGERRIAKKDVLLVVRAPGSAPANAAQPKKDGTAPAKTDSPRGEGKSAEGSSRDGLPEATKHEQAGLALETRARFKEAMLEFEQALRSAVTEKDDAKDAVDERGARIEFLVRRLTFFWNKLAERERAVDLLEWALAQAKGTPLSQDALRWYLVGQLRAIGKNDDADKQLAQLGYGTAWFVSGSYDNERGTGFSTAYGPEEEPFAPTARYKGKKREVGWRSVPVAKPLWGEIDLDAMYRPNDQALAYAVAYLHTDEPKTVALRLASDEALKVWVNRTAMASEEKRRPIKYDQTVFGVKLKAGWNEVLLKVCDQTGPWAFRCRVTALEGGPKAGVRWATVDEIAKAPAFEKGAEGATASRGAIDWLEARRKADATDHASRFHLGYLYYTDKPHDEGEHLDREALDEACKLDPKNAVYQVFYSHTAAANAEFSVNKEENKRRQALETALQLDPQYAVAAWLLAGYYDSSLGNATRARELLDQALAANPDFLDAELHRLTIDERRGLQPLALNRIRELAAKPENARYAPLVRRVLREDQNRQDRKATWERLSLLFSLDQTDASPLAEQAALARAQGRLDLALKLYQQVLALGPWDVTVRNAIASLHEQAGDVAAAEADLKSALEVVPEDDGLIQRLGRLVERSGRADEGRKLLEHALEINPNLVELKTYLEYLKRKRGELAKPFEDEWTLDSAAVVEAAKKVPLDPTIQSRVLLRNTVTKVNLDGTSSTFTQELERVENEEAAKELQEKTVGYHAGEQKATFKRARIWRKDGSTQDAQVSESSGGAGGGEFARYVGHSAEVDTLEVGDIVEWQWRIDDLTQTFFGEYFGTDEKFAEFGKPLDHVRFVLLAPKERKLFVHQTDLDDVKLEEKTDDKGVTARIWDRTGVKKIEPEPNMPWPQEVLPKVQVSTFQDWNTFSKWYWGLVKKQQESDEAIKKKVAELTKDCKTDEEKIRKIYNFVVSDIRYNASWEFGVHGFKPYNATSIFARKFGDCKDKATLINTMLAECKIESYPVLIFGANPRGKEDHALPLMHHFNHCISYVPGAKGGKGMWLDGTAQYHPFDTLPTMDYGASTLIVYPDKGEMKTIPFRGPEANQEVETHSIKVAPDGGAQLKSTYKGTGDFEVTLRQALQTVGRRVEIIEQQIGRHYTGAKVKKVECSDLNDLDKPVKIEVEAQLPRLLQKTTGGFAIEEVRSWLFDALYLQGQKVSGLAAKEARDFDVVLPVPSGVNEETIYELPPGTDVKSLPKETKLESAFGTYVRRYEVKGGKLHVVRTFEVKTNRIPRAAYDEFRKFVGTIERAEDERVILTKDKGEE